MKLYDTLWHNTMLEQSELLTSFLTQLMDLNSLL